MPPTGKHHGIKGNLVGIMFEGDSGMRGWYVHPIDQRSFRMDKTFELTLGDQGFESQVKESAH